MEVRKPVEVFESVRFALATHEELKETFEQLVQQARDDPKKAEEHLSRARLVLYRASENATALELRRNLYSASDLGSTKNNGKRWLNVPFKIFRRQQYYLFRAIILSIEEEDIFNIEEIEKDFERIPFLVPTKDEKISEANYRFYNEIDGVARSIIKATKDRTGIQTSLHTVSRAIIKHALNIQILNDQPVSLPVVERDGQERIFFYDKMTDRLFITDPDGTYSIANCSSFIEGFKASASFPSFEKTKEDHYKQTISQHRAKISEQEAIIANLRIQLKRPIDLDAPDSKRPRSE